MNNKEEHLQAMKAMYIKTLFDEDKDTIVIDRYYPNYKSSTYRLKVVRYIKLSQTEFTNELISDDENCTDETFNELMVKYPNALRYSTILNKSSN